MSEAVYKMGFDVSEALTNLISLNDTSEQAKSSLADLSSSGADVGKSIASSASTAQSGLDKISSAVDSLDSELDKAGKTGEDTGEIIKQSFVNVAKSTDSMGLSFAKNFKQAEKDSKSFSKQLSTGITGAFDTVTKKVKSNVVSWAKETSTSAKQMASALLHPIDTIKNKFSSAIDGVIKKNKDLEKSSADTGSEIEDTGKKGEKAGNSIGDSFGKAIKILAGIGAVVGLAVGIGKFVTSAMEASQVANTMALSFQSSFGDSSDAVENWVNNFSDATHRSETEIKGFLSSSKQMYNQLGLLGDVGTEMSEVTTSLAYDIGNFTGKADADALNDLQSAISGSNDALSYLGVTLDDTTLKQTALNMGITTSLADMDDATMAQVRYNSILEQTESVQGKATASIGGWAGGMKAMQAVGQDLMAKVGDKFTPIFDKFFGIILDLVPKVEPLFMKMADQLVSSLDTFMPIIADLADQLLPVLFDAFEQILPPVMELAEQLLPVFADILMVLIPPIAEIASQLLPVLADIIGTVATAVSPLIKIFTELIMTALEPIMPIFSELIEALLPPLSSMFESLAPIISALSPAFEFFGKVVGVVVEVIGKLVSGVADLISSGIDKIAGWFGGGSGGGVDTNATGTYDFGGGATRIHEQGEELILSQNSSGMAYLPKGSAVIPANATRKMLEENTKTQPVTNLAPTIVEVNPVIQGINPELNISDMKPYTEKDEFKKQSEIIKKETLIATENINTTNTNVKNQTSSKTLDINLNINISSDNNQTFTPEQLAELKESLSFELAKQIKEEIKADEEFEKSMNVIEMGLAN